MFHFALFCLFLLLSTTWSFACFFFVWLVVCLFVWLVGWLVGWFGCLFHFCGEGLCLFFVFVCVYFVKESEREHKVVWVGKERRTWEELEGGKDTNKIYYKVSLLEMYCKRISTIQTAFLETPVFQCSKPIVWALSVGSGMVTAVLEARCGQSIMPFHSLTSIWL